MIDGCSSLATLSFVTLLGACLLMAACTHTDTRLRAWNSSVAVPPALVAIANDGSRAGARKAAAQPIATLPEAMPATIQTVRTRDYVDGLAPGYSSEGRCDARTIQDSVTILARTDRRASLDEQVPLYKPTEAAIRSEIGGQFPHIAMQVVPSATRTIHVRSPTASRSAVPETMCVACICGNGSMPTACRRMRG